MKQTNTSIIKTYKNENKPPKFNMAFLSKIIRMLNIKLQLLTSDLQFSNKLPLKKSVEVKNT